MTTKLNSADKTERLLNLVICLLYTRKPLSKAKIRDAVPQYGTSVSDEAFDRMFERDKDELRDLGIPLVTEPYDVFFDDEPGYRIDRREYALPEISFAADELAVLGLASRAWTQASLAGPAAQALRKLEAAGVERDDSSLIGIVPRVRTAEPAFEALKDAVLRHTPVAFTYRTAATGGVAIRHVQPWAIASWHGHWYLTGFDTDRDAPRVFRLGRIEGEVTIEGGPGFYEVPAEHQPKEMISTVAVDRPPQTATLDVRAGAGHSLRRQARSTEAREIAGATGLAAASAVAEATGVPGAREITGATGVAGASAVVEATGVAGAREITGATDVTALPEETRVSEVTGAADSAWSRIEVDFTDPEAFAAEICSFGPDVVVSGPAELRESVIRRLLGALGPGPGGPSVGAEVVGA